MLIETLLGRLNAKRRRNLIESQGYAHPVCAQVEAGASRYQDGWQCIIEIKYLADARSLPKIQAELKRLRRPAASARPPRTTLNRRNQPEHQLKTSKEN
jgi:hypothetical protein